MKLYADERNQISFTPRFSEVLGNGMCSSAVSTASELETGLLILSA
jgi:hypothetical protein